MSDLYWLSEAQVERLRPYFPKSRGKPRVDDRRVLSGIIFIQRNGLMWKHAPKDYGPPKTREWTDVEKVWIFDESLQGFLQCSATARRFEISRVLRMRWCRDFQVGWGICLRKIDSGTG